MRKRYFFLFLLALFAVSALTTIYNTPVVSALQTEVVSAYVNEELPLADPDSSMWNQATEMDVPLSGQIVIAPKNEEPAVPSMRVRSLNNGTWVAFLLEWDDPTKNTGGGLTSFKDSAAIQFPSVEGQPFVCMGDTRNSVEILHWRADFQQDIEVGMPNASDVFPNMWVSIYPGGQDSTFLTGQGAGNPLSAADKTSPVEDLLAGGFGTLTSEAHNDGVGWANWENGTWKAVIARPMSTIDLDDAQFRGDMETSLALAAWDGGKGEINGKKSVSTWVTIKFEAPFATGPTIADAPALSPAQPAVERPPAPIEEIVVRTGLSTINYIILGISIVALVVIASVASWSLARRTARG